MDPTRWQRIQELFHQAADLPVAARRPWLDAQCGADTDLLQRVLGMLEADAAGSPLIDQGLAGVAAEVLEAAGPEPLPTQAFGPYRVVRLLGEGGMGVVYLGRRDDIDGAAAIKILRDASLSPARRERFHSEQRALAKLSHPAIARLLDADILPDGTPWFAMEYVEGEPLTTFCATHRADLTQRLHLLRAVAEAVQHAHQHAIIHRDLKPSNILVTPDGGVKLLDFGIARQLDDFERDATRTGLRLMTPAYAAPEQLRGAELGLHTDVYSLGVLLYELLAGRLPFDFSRLTPSEGERVVLEQEPERPSVAARGMAGARGGPPLAVAVSPRAWADLDVLCLTAMQKDPARRYRSTEALIRDIDHYLEGEPLEARPDTLGYRAGKFVRRNWRPLSLAGAVATLIVAVVVFYTLRLSAARATAEAAAARAERIQRFTMNLFQGGDDAAAPAESLRVVTLLERGVQEARVLDADPAAQAELLATLGLIYQQLGQLERADTLLRGALDRRMRTPGPGEAGVADGVLRLALLRADQSEYEEAERLAREGLERSRRNRPADNGLVGRALATLGRVQYERGQYDSAIATLKDAVQLETVPAGPTPELAESMNLLANAYFYAGDLDAADTLNQQNLVFSRKFYGERHPSTADDLLNLGAIRFQRGDFAGAERYDRDALAILRGWYGDDHPETASALTLLGRALVAQKQDTEGAAALRQALAIQERAYGLVHPRVASALVELALVTLRQGRYAEAEAEYIRVADIYRAVYGEKHYLVGIALSNRGNVYWEQRQYGRAEGYYRQALALFQGALGDGHLNTGVARIKLGRALVRQGRYREGETELTVGLAVVAPQSSPGSQWLRMAREELVTAYTALKQPADAEKYRAALADTLGPSASR